MNTELVLHYKSAGWYEVYYINGKYIADFICGDDGYWVYWSVGTGALSEGNLFDLYQNLQALNKEWDDIVQNDPRIGGYCDNAS